MKKQGKYLNFYRKKETHQSEVTQMSELPEKDFKEAL